MPLTMHDADDRVRLRCDQCGYVPTATWKGKAGSQCPRHWDPNSGCDGILRDDPDTANNGRAAIDFQADRQGERERYEKATGGE